MRRALERLVSGVTIDTAVTDAYSDQILSEYRRPDISRYYPIFPDIIRPYPMF